MLKPLMFSLLCIVIFTSCKNNTNGPDVSSVKINLTTKRFEKDFFAIDTNNIIPQINKLATEYPRFNDNFLTTILGIDSKWPPDTTAYYLKGFIAYNRSVYDSAEKIFADFSPYEKDIKQGLQHVKYYFPAYKIPNNIITYIGPADGYGDILDENVLIVGLHAHLGKDFPLYKTGAVAETYPQYITERFTPEYIVVNCIKNIVLDLYPENTEDKRLIIQMIEKGKRLYLLQQFLPSTDEYKLIGYTAGQMKDSYAHEAIIWDLFVQNNILQVADNNLIKNYVSEGPKTQELGENAPGNIGSFAGWQIVKKYLKKKAGVTPAILMQTDPEKIYQEAKYKP